MTEEQLRSMSEQDIRTRFQCAPAYYVQAMLEKKQAQRRSEKQAAADAEAARAVPSEPERLHLALPGFDILDAALSESDQLDSAPAENGDADPTLTQHAVLEAALEDYSNWPVLADAESEPEPAAVRVLEFELALILESEPELNLALESELEPTFATDIVTRAEFGKRAPRKVPVVSVIMDRKRPNMVRVIGKTTRLAG